MATFFAEMNLAHSGMPIGIVFVFLAPTELDVRDLLTVPSDYRKKV